MSIKQIIVIIVLIGIGVFLYSKYTSVKHLNALKAVQQQITKDLQAELKTSDPMKVILVEGNYARVAVNSPKYSTDDYIMKKNTQGWHIIAIDGLAVPECKPLDDANVPIKMYANCFDPSNNSVRKGTY